MSTKAGAVDSSKDIPGVSFVMMLFFLALWVLSLVSALGVVYTTYESRRAVQEIEELRREAIGLRVSTGKYLLEKSALGAYPRIETIAHEKLNMFTPISEKTVLVIRE